MQKIPITFAHEGQEYSGSLNEVSGAAAKMWYLMIDNYYCGRLRMYNGAWVFDPTPKDEWMKELAGLFGERVQLWYG